MSKKKTKDVKALMKQATELIREVEREAELGEALDRYTDPNDPEYDAEFTATIKILAPSWFA